MGPFDELMNRMRAFQESRALLTAVELDLFTAVGQGATAREAAARLQTDARATEMLLNALTSLGVLAKHDGVFRDTPLVAQYFAAGSPDNARLATMHIVHLWDSWSTLTECVRAGTSVARKTVAERGADWTEAFIAAMDRNAHARAPLVVKAVGTDGIRKMLDLGGGSAAYSIAFAKASPQLHAEVLDLRAVLPLTERYIGEAGLGDRVKTRPGDFTKDPFGQGYDLILASAICHMLGPDENRDLFRKSFEALAPGGRLVVQDFILAPDKTAPPMAALFALNMLVGTKNGSAYSQPEYDGWLREAGFQDVRHVPLEVPAELMVAAKK